MQKQVGDYKVIVEYDEYPENPRDWDNLGIIAYRHRRYILGDERLPSLISMTHEMDELETVPDYGEDAIDIVLTYAKEVLGAVVALPVYLYDHSGTTVRTTPFSSSWDSGLVGVIYTTEEKMEYQGVSPKRSKDELCYYLRKELETFDQYLRGEVYCFEVVSPTGKVMDSCCGFFDKEQAIAEGVDTAKYYDKEDKEAFEELFHV